ACEPVQAWSSPAAPATPAIARKLRRVTDRTGSCAMSFSSLISRQGLARLLRLQCPAGCQALSNELDDLACQLDRLLRLWDGRLERAARVAKPRGIRREGLRRVDEAGEVGIQILTQPAKALQRVGQRKRRRVGDQESLQRLLGRLLRVVGTGIGEWLRAR